MSHYAAGAHPALTLGCCIGTTTVSVKGGTFFMESYQASVASCYLLFLALVCRGFSSSMLAWSGSTRHSLVKRMLTAQAAANSQLNLLPAARLRLLISQGWFTWRLLTRAMGADLDLSEMDFLKPLEDMVALFLPQLQHTFGQNILQAAQEAGMRCDVVVLDGNAKNRRAVCAAALAGSSHSCATPAPGCRPSAMLFAVGIAKDLRTEKITSRCKGWVIVICVAFFWLKKCALVLDPNFRMWRLCTKRWSMMGSSLWFC